MMKNYTIIHNQAEIPNSSLINSVLSAAINSVDPYRLMEQYILLSNSQVCIGEISYAAVQNIVLIAMGKASVAMTQAAVDKLGEKITRGVCVCKALPNKNPDWANIELLQGSHPIPDEKSLYAAQRIRACLANLAQNDLVLVLISGGASALVVDPVESITLFDLQKTNELLLRSGASINEVNAVRKHLEKLKGGGLARIAAPAQVETLILSDVIGDPMNVIASGPTVADETMYTDVLGILDRYGLREKLPETVLRHLVSGVQGLVEETVKPGDPILEKVHNQIIGSNHHALTAAMKQAEALGIKSICLSDKLTGEARNAAVWFLKESGVQTADIKPPFMAVAGGETTVTVSGNGKGGRNLEFALAAVRPLAGHKDILFATLATDGEDGPTDAAGAYVTGKTLKRAQTLGLDPEDYLKQNDAYTFFNRADGLIKIHSTGTNVNDLTFLFHF